MLKKEMKKSACTVIKVDERGITFISMLLTLLIIMITLPFLVHILATVQEGTIKQDLSVQQFFVFIRNDALEARYVYSDNDTLYFYLNTDETAKISMYQNLIRRQVEGRGHEIYLRNIESLTVKPLAYGSRVIVTTIEGETYEKTIAHYNE